MKLLIFLLLLPLTTFANNYYVSSSFGNDANNGSQIAPFATLAKVNTLTLNAGDTVFLNKGDIFTGGLNIARSGSAGNPVVLSSYGSGSKPVISGFSNITSWTLLSGGVYQATATQPNMVLLDGSFQPISRYPKTTYLNVNSHSGNTINASLSGVPSFSGGEIVVRKTHWILDRATVNSQSTTSVTSSGGGYAIADGFGFFFQNHVNACTALGDWAYSGGKLLMYFGSGGPTGHTVQAASISNLNNLSGRSYLTFIGLAFDGSNTASVNLANSNHIVFTGCDITNSGTNGIKADASTNNITFVSGSINRSNSNAIVGSNSPNWIIRYNDIENTGMVAGMGSSGDGTYFGTNDLGNNSLVEYNVIHNTGYVGINFSGSGGNGNSVIIRYNLIDGYCIVKDDGGAIYTGNVAGPSSYSQRTISNNIVINGVGASAGAGGGTQYFSVFGIYMDDNAADVNIDSNTVANTAGAGIYLHNARNLNIRGNTVYNSGNEELLMANDNTQEPFRNINMNGNIWFNKTTASIYFATLIRSSANDIDQFGTWDNNHYCRPLNNESGSFYVKRPPAADFIGTLSQWKPLYSKDLNSTSTPIVVTDPNKIIIKYNASTSPVMYSLGGTYIDVLGNTYAGSITLQPYKSAVLILTAGGGNTPPTVNAGVDRVVAYPGTSVAVTATASDPGGSINLINWVKTVGGAYSIANGNTLTPTFSGLVAGTYQFQITVTDNGGLTATDAMQVTVQAAANTAPTANAGADQSVTTSSVNLSGSGMDAEGAVTYQWSKASGGGAIIAASGSRTTAVTGLATGTYKFVLKVTDAGGLAATDTMQVIVTIAAPTNQTPKANAGPDLNITLPANTVNLLGSGSDVDGTISSYSWAFVSGPSTYSIASPGSAQTAINNLGQGQYMFMLTVTDNSGATATDNVSVTVNPATIPPVSHPPISKAGNDITIFVPKSSAQMNGLAADYDGPVTIKWTQVSGPSAAIISNPTTVSTTMSGLIQGYYDFRQTVTDNAGNVVYDDVIVTVKKCSFWDKIFGRCK